MIQDFGTDGASIESVLDIWAPSFRLKYKHYSYRRYPHFGTRPVIACFYLSGTQWHNFSRFFKHNPRGTLTPADLGPFPSKLAPPRRGQACAACTADGLPACNCGGHAVVLMRDTGGRLTLLNSWGAAFADRGRFRVRDAATLRLDLYDLALVRTPAEKQAFMLRGCQAVLRMAGLGAGEESTAAEAPGGP
jgi:hypothetical protein